MHILNHEHNRACASLNARSTAAARTTTTMPSERTKRTNATVFYAKTTRRGKHTYILYIYYIYAYTTLSEAALCVYVWRLAIVVAFMSTTSTLRLWGGCMTMRTACLLLLAYCTLQFSFIKYVCRIAYVCTQSHTQTALATNHLPPIHTLYPIA